MYVIVTQNAVRPGVRSYVPPEMAEDDFWLIIYHCLTIYNKTPKMSEFEYNVTINNIIYI